MYLFNIDIRVTERAGYQNNNIARNRNLNLCLGLKPLQRKVMFTCFMQNMTEEVKVSHLAGSVALQTGFSNHEVSFPVQLWSHELYVDRRLRKRQLF